MSGYTLQEFHDAGLEPKECDSGPYGDIHEGPETYRPCQYHEGYIDGYESGARDNR